VRAGKRIPDSLHPKMGDESFRCAMMILSPGVLWGGWHPWVAVRAVASELPRASVHDDSLTKIPSETVPARCRVERLR
jgi:hypothetical protein